MLDFIDNKIISNNNSKVNNGKIHKFIIISADGSGFGLAELLLSNATGRGNPREEYDKNQVIFAIAPKDTDDRVEYLEKVGEGIVEQAYFDDLWNERKKYKDWLWIFDANHNSDKADQLRKEGYLVFGGQALADKMEHDRSFAVSLVKEAGLPVLPFKEFSDISSGLDYLDANEETAFVFKPDEPDDISWVTTCPDQDNDIKANREIYEFLKSQPDGKGTYILQERKKGIEINCEVFLYEGEPFFAHANFECKKKYVGDYGKYIGCAQDVEFTIPLDCKILKETLYKLIDLNEFADYTGFVDMNLIVADNEYWFLEFCCRIGYNATPNLLLSLSLSPLSDILNDFINGETDDFYRHFRSGFGASISCLIDDPCPGLPLSFDDETDESRFYPFETYLKDGKYYLAGYSQEVGIAISHDYDLPSACEDALIRFKHIYYTGKAGRTDLALKNYQSNPTERYNACMSMKLFEVNYK